MEPLVGVSERKPRGYYYHRDTARGAGTGGNMRSQNTITQLNSVVYVCPICLSLARITDALRVTGKGNIIAPGVGCGGNHHDHRRYRADKHVPRQKELAIGIACGSLALVQSPEGLATTEVATKLRERSPSFVRYTLRRFTL